MLDKIKQNERMNMMKMVLGAVQKKEEQKVKAISIWVIIGLAVAGFILWGFLGK